MQVDVGDGFRLERGNIQEVKKKLVFSLRYHLFSGHLSLNNFSSGRPPFPWSTFTSICWEPHQNLATELRSYDMCNEYSSIDVQN